MANTIRELAVGDETVMTVRGHGRRGPRPMTVTVAKIGYKWIYVTCTTPSGHVMALDRYQFDIDTGEAKKNKYGSPGRLWPSWKAYEADLERNELIERIRKLVVALDRPSRHLGLDETSPSMADLKMVEFDLRNVCRLLGVDLEALRS